MEHLIAQRLWYAAMTPLGCAYYAYEPTNTVYRRPSWAPIFILKNAVRIRHLARIALTILGASLAISQTLVNSQLARLAFFVALAICDISLSSAIYNHVSYVFLYTAAALVLPADSSRFTVLRIIFTQQLASSGIMKLRISGFRGFCHPDSMERWMSFSLKTKLAQGEEFYSNPHRMVDDLKLMSNSLVSYLLARPWARSLLHTVALIMELCILPLGLLVRGPFPRFILFAVAAAFHLGTMPLMGIIFPHSLPCYALALLPVQADQLSFTAPASLVASTLLCMTTVLGSEDWPHNCMAMFPYSGVQSDALRSLRGRFVFAFSSDPKGQVDTSRCVSTICVAACPASYNPGFVRAVTGSPWLRFSVFPDHRPLDSDATIHSRLQSWVHMARPYLDVRTWRPFDEVRYIDTTPTQKRRSPRSPPSSSPSPLPSLRVAHRSPRRSPKKGR